MLRYYLISTAIVVALGILAGALAHRRATELRVASVQSTGSPSPPRAQAASTESPRAVRGDAPWAMSAVPECFHQQREVHGPATYVRAHMPGGARPLPSGTTLRVGDCEVRVAGGSVVLRRGVESLRVPPQATLYALPRGDLALVRTDPHAAVLRVYRPSTLP